eukprot:1054830-Amphidinium_carterae.1
MMGKDVALHDALSRLRLRAKAWIHAATAAMMTHPGPRMRCGSQLKKGKALGSPGHLASTATGVHSTWRAWESIEGGKCWQTTRASLELLRVAVPPSARSFATAMPQVLEDVGASRAQGGKRLSLQEVAPSLDAINTWHSYDISFELHVRRYPSSLHGFEDHCEECLSPRNIGDGCSAMVSVA